MTNLEEERTRYTLFCMVSAKSRSKSKSGATRHPRLLCPLRSPLPYLIGHWDNTKVKTAHEDVRKKGDGRHKRREMKKEETEGPGSFL